MPQPTKRILTVYWQMWSGKLPTVLHNGQSFSMRVPDAREFALKNGYAGIRLIPSQPPKLV